MSKIETHILDNLHNSANNLGIAVMTIATVVGMLELPDRAASANRFILPSQVARVESVNDIDEANNPVRRESEETSEQLVSYSQSQRTPPRSGKL